MAESAPRPPLRLLSLDGGGIRGISELIILQEIMHRLKKKTNSEVDLLPADYFDMICGTSTGGLIAILLGRLRLSVPAAIEQYATLSQLVFGEKKRFGNILKDGAFKASNLEKAIKKALKAKSEESQEDEKMWEEGSGGCKTFVCARLAKHLDTGGDPTLFRTWEGARDPGHNCTILEACRATSAAPRFFKRVRIGPPGLQEEYIDGGMGCNNPVKILVEEAILEFDPETEISCILSIGTGRPKLPSIGAPGAKQLVFPSDLIKALASFTTSSVDVAKDVDSQYRKFPGLMQRLNVEEGLEEVSLDEWNKLGEVKSHTTEYLRRKDVDKRIETIVAALRGTPEQRYHLGQLDNSVLSPSPKGIRKLGFHSFPSYLVHHFVERKEVLEDMSQHFISSRGSSKPPVYVLQGLGGCGKSQLALKYCQKIRDENPWGHVLWIDATSLTTARQSIATIVQIMSPGISTTDHEANLHHFKQTIHASGACEQKWLLVFDNYDDPDNFKSKSLKDFFSQATHGSIIVTTRITEVRRLGKYWSVSKMTEAESLRLLLRSSELEECHTNTEEGNKIVTRLGFHALAIDQAGAYIRSRGLELRCFLDDYTKRREKILKEIPKEWSYFGRLKENPNAEIELSVFTTWELSLDQVSGTDAVQKDKKHILTLSGFLNNTEIKAAYFQAHAYENVTWLPSCQNDTDWDVHKFEDILRELRNLSLLESFVAGSAYSIHPLIQDWIKLRISLDLRKEYALEATSLLSSYILDSRDPTEQLSALSLEEKQILLAHVNNVLSHRQEYRLEESDLQDENDLKAVHEFGHFLFTQGYHERAERLCRQVLEIQKRALGDEHPKTLTSMANLAAYLTRQAKYYEAEPLYEGVISLTKRVESESSGILLRSTNNFAILLLGQNRCDEAERLLQSILPEAERALGREHPNILTGKSILASSFAGQERYDEAEVLHREILTVRKSTLGEEHHGTLGSMNNLALVLKDQDKLEEAGKLYRDCLFVTEKVHGKLHPETLMTVYNMGVLYLKLENLIDGETFIRRALEGQRVVLGLNHPDTLKSYLELGVVSYKNGNFDAAEEIFRSLIPRFESVFDHNHRETTRCIDWLVGTLQEAGKEQEAQELQRDLDQRIRKREEEVGTKAKAAFGQWEIGHEEPVAEDSEQESSSDSWSTVDS